MTTDDKPQFVYDQDCAFCQRFVRTVERHCSDRVSFIGSRDYEGVGSEQTISSSILVFRQPERVYVGSAGIGELLTLTDSAGFRLAGNLILTPVLSTISALAYRWIADHRHWFRPGCDSSSGTCALRSK
ncbi:DCC1-like thiol-disulfide oxidoreductase family protein [Actinomyces qiguomingii]|uniref:thiol-disulfide oxidoreductase DCC family protein n=1 Tax=Actinomyces qiguomingii TaxID=2057800 RepID=UPI001304E034